MQASSNILIIFISLKMKSKVTNRILECVPNFSEGRNPEAIQQIIAAISSVDKVKLLHVDTGKDANRTVVTFAGEPEAVVEAAFRGAKKATEVIDMTKQTGEHPRFGALDVCPLVPISGITMEETITLARALGNRIGSELNIHVYSYGYAAFSTERRDLAYCRSGEYEGLPIKLKKPEWKPDYGPVEFNTKSGASAVGARDILIAYNVNLNTKSAKVANDIALEIREKGKLIKIENSTSGEKSHVPGSLKAVKAIGWYMEEFGCAQVSINLTNINITPLHIAFEEVCRKAEHHDAKVTGSEIVGLVPLNSLLNAGRYFLQKEKKPVNLSEEQLIETAIKKLGLNQLYKFNPKKKIIEWVLAK
jgi:glutamate formiminotransferase/formiminotetrahydrofolate cyclodeaminase